MAAVLSRRLGKRSLLGARVAAPDGIVPEPARIPAFSSRHGQDGAPGSPNPEFPNPGNLHGQQVPLTSLDEQIPGFPTCWRGQDQLQALPHPGIPQRSVSSSIDVPKRRSLEPVDMDEMVAALVLTSLSCSPALTPWQVAGDPWKDGGDVSDSGSSTTSGHWSSVTSSPPHGSATMSPPHCAGSVTSSPPHGGVTMSPPHCAGSATSSPPHGGVTLSPPHGGVTSSSHGSVTSSPPHNGVTLSPPHGTVTTPSPHSSATMSPPHGGATMSPLHGSVTLSPPHRAGSATMSPSHDAVTVSSPHGSATMSPPHGTITMSPPHRAGSATVSPPRGSATVSPPRGTVTSSPPTDDGFDTDPEPSPPEEPARRRRKHGLVMFKCLWPGCGKVLRSGVGIKRHVRTRHLGDGSEREEDFYYTELQVAPEPPTELPPPAVTAVTSVTAVTGATPVPSVPAVTGATPCSAPIVIPGQPGLSHSAPPGSFWHIQADHAYQALPSIQIPVSPHIFTSISWAAATSTLPSLSPVRSRSLSLSEPQAPPLLQPQLLVASPPRLSLTSRKTRGEAKKCRKVYGIEHRDQWCTACRWKKACQRFLD